MKQTSLRFFTARWLLLPGIFATALTAQDLATDADIILLPPFTVTTDRAQTVLHITERDLAQRQANDLEDALSIDPSITVGGSTAVAQKIYVRNLGEGLLNVSVDGATQSGSLFHHIGRIAIEPGLLKRIEVQPGVGHAADGPGTLGGAIRFITKDPLDLLRSDQTVGGQIKGGYFTNTRGWKGSVVGAMRVNETWSTLLSAVVSDHGEIEDGRGNRLAGSDSKQKVYLGKVVGTFSSGQSLRLGLELLDEEGNKLRRPEWAPGPGNPSFYMESQRRTFTSSYGLQPNEGGWLDLDIALSYSEADVLQIATFGPYTGDVRSVQLDIRNSQTTGMHRLVYGVDHRRDEVSAGPDGEPTVASEEATITGLFLQDEITISDQLAVSAGARFDSYRLDDRLDQSFDHDGFSPNIGVTYNLNSVWSINASYATAYRGPDINDAFRVDIAENDPDLAAEKAQNYEARVSYHHGNAQFEAGAYANRIDDVITNTLPWSRVYTNAGDLDTDGFFARATYATSAARFGLQYNHADTTIDGQTATRYQYSSLVSRIGDTWVADASWRVSRELDLGWNWRVVQGVDRILVPEYITGLPDTFIDKPGYATHDFYVRWSPATWEQLTIDLTVKNVFDKQYLSHGSIENLTAIPDFEAVVGAPEPGRDIRVSATVRF